MPRGPSPLFLTRKKGFSFQAPIRAYEPCKWLDESSKGGRETKLSQRTYVNFKQDLSKDWEGIQGRTPLQTFLNGLELYQRYVYENPVEEREVMQ